MKYISGPYTQGMLLRDIHEIELSLTHRFLRGGAITDAAEQRSWRERVEDASFGRNTVLYDDLGYPSVMVVIPAVTLNELYSGWPNQLHPAFIVGTSAQPLIYFSKYQNYRVGSGTSARAVSLRYLDPTVDVTLAASMAACTQKGPGWHLTTNAEWALIALLCRANGFMPRGNNLNGRDHAVTSEKGIIASATSTSAPYRVLTGSGPVTWTHDGTPFGIWDLNGNVGECVLGLKLINGRIYVHPNNTFTVGDTQGSTTNWVDTELYFDNTTPGNNATTSHDVGGDPILSADRTNPMYTGGDGDYAYGFSQMVFQSLTAKTNVTVPHLLKYLAIYPADSGDHGGDALWVRNYGERVALRGGNWSHAAHAGVFALDLRHTRSLGGWFVGFRAVFISI